VLNPRRVGDGQDWWRGALHSWGRANGPVRHFNCSNLVESLAESQALAAYPRAFTDAARGLARLLSLGQRGTLCFSTRSASCLCACSPQLLRAVETHSAAGRLGSQLPVDIRLNRGDQPHLRADGQSRQFATTLLYRLNATANPSWCQGRCRERRDANRIAGGAFHEHTTASSANRFRYLSLRPAPNRRPAVIRTGPATVREFHHAMQSRRHAYRRRDRRPACRCFPDSGAGLVEGIS